MALTRSRSDLRPLTRSSRTAIGESRTGETSQIGPRVASSRKWPATAGRVLALFALILVAVRILADTWGQNLAVSDPEGALALAPWEVLALDELAQRQLTSTSGNLSSAENLAQR